MEIVLPEFGLFFWTVVIFLVVFFLLKSLAWKPILKALADREQGIAEKLAKAAEAESKMNSLMQDYDKIIKKASEERDQLIKEANEHKEQIISEAKKQATAEADKLVSNARQQIQMEKNAALAEIRQQSVDLALTIAEKVLKRKLDNPEEDKKFINTLITDLNLN